MDKEVKVITRGGVGFVGLLQIVFIVLKLCNVIAWPWVCVMLPLIITTGFWIICFIIFFIIAWIACK